MRTLKKEKGAVVVEATLVIPMFIFLVITIMWIANLCTAQAKIQTAINSSAKEISSFSYIYGLSGLNQARADLAEGGAESADTADEAIKGIKGIYDGLGQASDAGAAAVNGKGVADSVESAKDSYNSISGGVDSISEAYKRVKNDPKKFIIGLGKELASEATDEISGRLVGGLAKFLCEKHLSAGKVSADTYLRKLGVVNGFNGIKFHNTRYCNKGGDDIIIVAQYQLAPIKFFNIDIKYNIVQTGRTKAWFGKSTAKKQEAGN